MLAGCRAVDTPPTETLKLMPVEARPGDLEWFAVNKQGSRGWACAGVDEGDCAL